VSIDQSCIPVVATFTNSSQNASSYQWDFGGGNIQNLNNLNGFTQTYLLNGSVQLVAYEGLCSDTTNITVSVIPCGCMNPIALNYDSTAVQDDGSCILPEIESIVPNVLTANNDGVNDLFFITVGNYTTIQLTIMNRWGGIVFDQTAIAPNNVAWNGMSSAGNKLEDGVYFYKYSIEGIAIGSNQSGHGFVTLSN
jgi:gliding motility-associated-like protein